MNRNSQEPMTNACSQIGGVPCHEINNLELEFLFMINFTLNVPQVKCEVDHEQC